LFKIKTFSGGKGYSRNIFSDQGDFRGRASDQGGVRPDIHRKGITLIDRKQNGIVFYITDITIIIQIMDTIL